MGLHRADDEEGGWMVTFPPPSIHLDATPEVIRSWYEKQLEVDGYAQFLKGYDLNVSKCDGMEEIRSQPVIFGTIDDHDYGQNNGDYTYRYKKESNLAFIDFLYGNNAEQQKECTALEADEEDSCGSTEEEEDSSPNRKQRSKLDDPMYERSLDGKGVYGVQLFDFSQRINTCDGNKVWGDGYWVPESQARIDPDVVDTSSTNITAGNYSTAHSVAVFVLDVRTNKTPWPKGKNNNLKQDSNSSNNTSSMKVPALDFLGAQQWEWFQSALANSHARVNIIVSGLQVHTDRFPPDGNVVEEWSKFSESRDMLYDMILNSGVKSPLLISGDVHMSQFLRKDCLRSSDIQKMSNYVETKSSPSARSLIEVTTSGMTHSWGTSFSSQPKHHTWPLWPYSYLVSRTFMTVCHLVCPWNEIITQKKEMGEGPNGKQYFLGINFAELEFDFADEDADSAVIVKIFGTEENEAPKLQARWTFDELAGAASLSGMTAKLEDFASLGKGGSDWICVPYRGFSSSLHHYTAIAIQFIVFFSLLFLPYMVATAIFLVSKRLWLSRRHHSNDVEVGG